MQHTRALGDVCDGITQRINTGQVSKFLLWSDHNSEAIDQLDYVMAPSSSAPPGNGPMFVFGVDDGAPAGDDPSDDGKQQF